MRQSRLGLLLQMASVFFKTPAKVFKILSRKNFRTLLIAFKHESPKVIFKNFLNLVRTGQNATSQLNVPEFKKKDKIIIPNFKNIQSLAKDRQTTLLLNSKKYLDPELDPSLSILIDISVVSYNDESWIETFTNSLVKQSYPIEKINLTIIDNGSSDDTLRQWIDFKKQWDGKFYDINIFNRLNNGFGAGHNYAFTKSISDFFLVTNVDLEIERNAIQDMLSFAMHDDPLVASWEFRQKPFEHPKYYDPVTLETSWSSHACILMKSEAFRKVNGYSKKIFMYGEDVDISFRFRDKGYKLRYYPKAVVWHYTYAQKGQVKPLQFLYSTLANSYLRLRFGTIRNILTIPFMQLSLMAIIKNIPVKRMEILKNYFVLLKTAHFFLLSRKQSNLTYPFRKWDYEIARDGAFYESPKIIDDINFPKVSIITRTYKGRVKWLKECISSVINQSYPLVELVIVEDGGATMQSFVQEVTEKYPNFNLNYFPCSKLGRSGVGNIGLKNAGGDLLMFLDDDDLLFADHVETLVKAILKEKKKGNEYKAAYALSWEVLTKMENKEGKFYTEKNYVSPNVFQTDFSKEKLKKFNFIPIQAILFSRELFEKYGGFNESLMYLEDWNLWVRYANENDFLFVKKTTSLFRTPYDEKERQKRSEILHSYYDTALRANNESLLKM